MDQIKQILQKHLWIGPLIGFIIGPGVIWSFADYNIKNESAERDKIRLEKEFYERIQILQNDILSSLPHYLSLRDKYLANTHDKENSPEESSKSHVIQRKRDPQDVYETQNEYNIELEKISSKIVEYYVNEKKLSAMEGRSERLFKLPLPYTPPLNLHIEEDDKGIFLVSDPYVPDPLIAKIQNTLKDFENLSKQKSVQGSAAQPVPVPVPRSPP